MWDVFSGDFDQNFSKEGCLQHHAKYTNNGSIVVFHDSEKSFKNLDYVLPKSPGIFLAKGHIRFSALYLPKCIVPQDLSTYWHPADPFAAISFHHFYK